MDNIKDYPITFRVQEAMEALGTWAKAHAAMSHDAGIRCYPAILASIVLSRKYTHYAIRRGFDWHPGELTKDVLRILTSHYEMEYVKELQHMNESRTISIDKYANKQTLVNQPN